MAKKEIDKKALNAEISKAMMNDFERVGMGFVTYWKLIACAAVGLAVLIAAICWAASYQRSSAKNARERCPGAERRTNCRRSWLPTAARLPRPPPISGLPGSIFRTRNSTRRSRS